MKNENSLNANEEAMRICSFSFFLFPKIEAKIIKVEGAAKYAHQKNIE